jgi:hypothetical protein
MDFSRTYHRLLIAFAAFLFPLVSVAQDVKASAVLDTTAILLGEQVKLQLRVQYRADNGKHISVQWPEISDTLRKEIEVVSQGKLDTIVDKSDPFLFTLSKTITVTSFDSGYWAVPPFHFGLSTDTNGVFTEPLLLQVNTVAVDTTQAIKDIKAPYGEVYGFMDWIKDHQVLMYTILGTLLLILVIIFIIIKMRKIQPPMVIVEKPKTPAHIIAFEKLEKLKAEKLWQEGKLKQYHSSVTDVLREYIENRFKIQALEQTTDEILFSMRNVAVDEESKMRLKQVLRLADLVKFAKEQPAANDNELSMNNTYEFINGTKREEEYQAEKVTFVDAPKKNDRV